MRAESGCTAVVLVCLAASGPVRAHPEGAPWETVEDREGCTSCHFDSPDPHDSASVRLSGLPNRVRPGQRYELTLGIDDETLRLAGFLLTVTGDGVPAGSLAAVDGKVEARGAQARSTRAGATPVADGSADWRFAWTAPDVLPATLRFDVWANAGNDDESPFGDRTHHRVWTLPR